MPLTRDVEVTNLEGVERPELHGWIEEASRIADWR